MKRRHFLPLLAAGIARAAPATRIKIAQIGTQHAHAAGKLEAVQRLPDLYELVGLADIEPSQSKAYANLPRLSVDALFAMPDLQAVTIETALERSCEMALRAIEAGKHVHLDKPGAVSHADFQTMRLAAEKRGLTVQMGYMLRHHPCFDLMFRAVREGWLGEITEVDAMMGKLADAKLRAQLKPLVGGGMFELGCHMVDAAMTILGKPHRVHAMSTPTRDDGFKDNQLAVLEYPRATASLRCNHADPFGGPRRRFMVTGTRGSMEIMPMEGTEMIVRLDEAHGEFKKGEQTVKLPKPAGRYDAEFTTLAKVIRGEMKFPWDAAHDIAVHEAVLRAAGVM